MGVCVFLCVRARMHVCVCICICIYTYIDVVYICPYMYQMITAFTTGQGKGSENVRNFPQFYIVEHTHTHTHTYFPAIHMRENIHTRAHTHTHAVCVCLLACVCLMLCDELTHTHTSKTNGYLHRVKLHIDFS